MDGSQVATAVWTTIDTMTINCEVGNEIRLTYFLEAVTNNVSAQIQASVNNINWITLNTRDMQDVDGQEAIINVPAGGSAVAVISPQDRSGINCGYQYYRLQIQGAFPFGTINCWADGKPY